MNLLEKYIKSGVSKIPKKAKAAVTSLDNYNSSTADANSNSSSNAVPQTEKNATYNSKKTTYEDYLRENYDRSIAEQEEAKKNQQQQASVLLTRLQKYLPQQQRAAGTVGLYTGSTAELQAQNAYTQRMAEAESTFNANKMQLDRAYQTDLQSYRTEQSARAYNDLANYLTMEAEDMMTEAGDQKLSQEQYSKLQNYINDKSSSLTAEDKASLDHVLELYRGKIRSESDQLTYENDQSLNTVATKDGYDIKGYGQHEFGNNFRIEKDNETYKVQSGGEVTDETILQKAKTVSDGTVFTYGGKIYVKIGGKVSLVEARDVNKDGYRKLVEALNPTNANN